jgi:hypothetical protein
LRATNLGGLGREEFEGEGGLPFSPRLGQLLGDVHGGEGTVGEEKGTEEGEETRGGREEVQMGLLQLLLNGADQQRLQYWQ